MGAALPSSSQHRHAGPPSQQGGHMSDGTQLYGAPWSKLRPLGGWHCRLRAWLPSPWTGPPSGEMRPGASVYSLPHTASSTRAEKWCCLSSRGGQQTLSTHAHPALSAGSARLDAGLHPRLQNLHSREPRACAPSTHLATDWMTLEEVSLMLVKRRSVPPRRMSRNPP